MNSESSIDPLTAPFITEFTLAIIMALRGRRLYTPERQVIHSDMVPKMSHHVLEASMMEQVIPPRVVEVPKKALFNPEKKEPLKVERINNPVPEIKKRVNPEVAWNKIKPLMDDVAVTSIECGGPGRNLMVIRAAGRQPTRIVLSGEEIKVILETVAERTHIPLLEGVFRTQDDGYSVHAVVSDIIGSKFVIKKDTPYNLLEDKNQQNF